MPIKLAFLDVDGVLVGKKYPFPSSVVIDVLKKARGRGTKIVLTTSKPLFSKDVMYIIQKAQLDNLHITGSGNLIADESLKTLLQRVALDRRNTFLLLDTLRKKDVFFAVDTTDRHLIDEKYRRRRSLVNVRQKILQVTPHLVTTEEMNAVEVMRIVIKAQGKNEVEAVETIIARHKKAFNFGWNRTPVSGEIRWGMITPRGITKGTAALKVADYYDIPMSHALGIGDTLLDWEFMKECGYVATLENAEAKVKQLVSRKRKDHAFIGPSVDKDGIISIFTHFRADFLGASL